MKIKTAPAGIAGKNGMKLKIGFKDEPVVKQVQYARQIEQRMTSSPYFSTPLIAELGAAADALEQASIAALTGDTIKKAIMRVKRKTLLKIASRVASYVDMVADGNDVIIHSAGFDVRKKLQRFQTPEQVVIRGLLHGINSGQLIARWKAVKTKKIYRIELSTDITNPAAWEVIGETTSCNFTIFRLTPGVVYWVRVVAVGTKGVIGTYSNAARQMCV